MTDTKTLRPLRVSNFGKEWPYIMLSVHQVQAVRDLLDANQIHYKVDDLAISLDGNPEMTVISLGRDGDAIKVQRLLDSVG